MAFNRLGFSIVSSGGHFVQRRGTICLKKGITESIFVIIFFKFGYPILKNKFMYDGRRAYADHYFTL